MPLKNTNSKKIELHSRNKNHMRYDLKAMAISNPELSNFIKSNKYGSDSIDFSDPDAVKVLNKSILIHYYGIKYWEFPHENLCPPIPGRAEYIHHVADLLSESNDNKILLGNNIKCLDIGTGASCIYPIIGTTEYKWSFIATDIDLNSIKSAQNIISSNPSLKDKIVCRVQKNPKFVFQGIIRKEEKFEISICNPPFHSSAAEALKSSKRKVKNLTGQKVSIPKLNFSGLNNELVYQGGEYKFIRNMVSESKVYRKNCLWFSSLVSKESNLKKVYKCIQNNNALDIRTINIRTGNKISRIVAWTYFNDEGRKRWIKNNNC